MPRFYIHDITQCWTPISSIIQGILISPKVAWVFYMWNQLFINPQCKNIGLWLRIQFDLSNTIFDAYIFFSAIEASNTSVLTICSIHKAVICCGGTGSVLYQTFSWLNVSPGHYTAFTYLIEFGDPEQQPNALIDFPSILRTTYILYFDFLCCPTSYIS